MPSRCALVVVALAACGDFEHGAVLAVRAPDGPASASRIEIVLANADASAISLIADQRLRPGDFETGPTRYYRQRETGGIVENIARLDGFVVRVAPNTERVPDVDFVPFILAYDGATLAGIGVVLDSTGTASAIRIEDGYRDNYEVRLWPVAPADLQLGIADGETATLACADAPSGFAWQHGGEQYRLLVPASGAFDATPRAADLDCDQHAAAEDDCDDLRATYHDGVAETCDGQDTNCDGARFAIEHCDSTCGPGSGITMCRDLDGGMQTSCAPNAQCRCNAGAGCPSCDVEHVGSTAGDRTLCAPAIGKLGVDGCAAATCAVDLIPTDQPWKLQVSADGMTFGRSATIANGELFVRAEYFGPTPVPGAMPDLGTIHLAIGQNATTRYLGVALKLADNFVREVCEPDGSGTHLMTCTQ